MDFPDTMNQPARRSSNAKGATRQPSKRYHYQIDRLSEGVLSSVFLGSANINEKKLQDHVNARAAQGYRLVFQVLEQKRTLLLGKRESLILTFESATS